MRRLALLTLLAHCVYPSPPMCQCPGGQLGMSCPSPIQLNCPPMQCPPPPPCNPFPTLGTLMPLPGVQGLSQFTLPTLAPISGSAFGPQSTTPLPLPVVPPANGQESLVPIQNNQYNAEQQQQYQQQQQQQSQQQQQQQQQQQELQQQQSQQQQQQQLQESQQQHEQQQEFHTAPPPPPPQRQVSVQPAAQFAETIPVDATTRVTTLPSESYVEADLPEEISQEEIGSERLPLYENQPNTAQAANNGKPEVFTDKCNDERLKKIIEENVDANPSSSKRKIQKAATDEIGGLFDVICSNHDFSYLANTQVFCEAGNDDVTCFAFLHSLIQ
ncbi:Ground domain-containing protein [Trichostrongylus colubriformis]|uniref:Ground domain-containing protein n=1 Tax=Trichostrongylus colubriformis TaxID=6319 RepID=A0AAN8F9V9_TRICO